MKAIVQAIMKKVLKCDNGCWEWQGKSVHKFGYGFIYVAGKQLLVHRVMLEEKIGALPEGLCACHKCDNPSCINPDHLFAGTHQENISDAGNKGRKLQKLTPAQVLEILNATDTYKNIGVMYGVSAVTVSNIKNGKVWRHVTGL